ncbi:fimbria/pilus outer membrane usher protein [Pseudomonas sp. McL0111]|uniref:fimbria/pilus outer membrane usher protein n=1 Tax=Pseudomonas sp. McL0111 TaxID=3457357 RepID=UPI00403E93C8
MLGSGEVLAASSVEQVEFNPAFFQGGAAGKQFDISRFNTGNVVLPGVFRSDVYINGAWIGREELTFAAVDGQPSAQLCLDRSMLVKLGVDVDGIAQKASQAGVVAPPPFPAKPFCADIGIYVPDASATFDSGESKLDIQVPQLYMTRMARGYVSPEHWDDGINAGFVRYNANTYSSKSSGVTNNSGYLGLNSGLNLGEWNFRHNGAYSRDQESAGYQSSATYVQRGFSSLQSEFTGGEIYTSGELFDSVRLRGVTLATDDRMMPDSMTGYAPIVRGVAETNAKVTIRQRGMLLDEITVPPGPFVIEDLFPNGYGGDLEITVTEADGRRRQFIVPFASNAHLLRPGYQRFSLSSGVMADPGLSSHPWLMQGTYQRGLNNVITAYTGGNTSQDYLSELIGAAFNTPIGAVSLDVTASQASVPTLGAMQGQSLQVRYNKNFAETGTNFALGAFRYSTDGFLSPRDAAQLRETVREGGNVDDVGRLRERFDISLSQSFERGSVFLTGSQQEYWNRQSSTVSFTAGYSGSWDRVSYTVTAQRSRDLVSNRSSNQIDLSFSIPIGRGARSPMLSTTLSHGDTQDTARTGVSGVLGERNQINYGASTSYSSGNGSSKTTNADVTYRGQNAETSASYSDGTGYRAASLGVSGGVVVHSGGVILAPELGDTIGIVHATGAEGAGIGSSSNARVGANGYGVVPYLVPYRSNSVELDPKDMSQDVELKTASQNVAPKAGAVVMMGFDTSTGRAMLINAVQADGSPIPFGADVFDEAGTGVGVVGQAGRMFVRTAQDKGELTVRWGEGADAVCRIPFDMSTVAPSPANRSLAQMNGVCRRGA